MHAHTHARVVKKKEVIFSQTYFVSEDRPLIVQFAASCANEFADAAEIVSP